MAMPKTMPKTTRPSGRDSEQSVAMPKTTRPSGRDSKQSGRDSEQSVAMPKTTRPSGRDSKQSVASLRPLGHQGETVSSQWQCLRPDRERQ